MGRKYHSSLKYERQQLKDQASCLKSLSDVCWNCHDEFGKAWVADKVWTWVSGITFQSLTKDEFKKVKSMLPGLSTLVKETNEHSVTLDGKCYDGNLRVEFKWGLPNSCEITYETVLDEIGEDKFFTDAVGRVFLKNVKAVVNCKEPIMETVFKG